MENAETLTEVQIQEFLKGSEGIVFEGQSREERYRWVQGVLVAQEYAAQDKKRRGTVRAYMSKVTGLSLPQVTRLIRQYRAEGVVIAAAYGEDRPFQDLQRAQLRRIAFPVGFQFRLPVFKVRFRGTALAAAVSVPEAAMDEDSFHPSPEYDIRPAGEIFRIQPVSVAEAEQDTSNGSFRTCVTRLDRLHDPATLLWSPRVCHCVPLWIIIAQPRLIWEAEAH
jgi:hypothetical protein